MQEPRRVLPSAEGGIKYKSAIFQDMRLENGAFHSASVRPSGPCIQQSAASRTDVCIGLKRVEVFRHAQDYLRGYEMAVVGLFQLPPVSVKRNGA